MRRPELGTFTVRPVRGVVKLGVRPGYEPHPVVCAGAYGRWGVGVKGRRSQRLAAVVRMASTVQRCPACNIPAQEEQVPR